MAMDEGDDLPKRASRTPSLLRYNEQDGASATRQTRSKGGKVTTNTIRPNVVARADAGAELRCVRLAVAQLARREWECYIALKEGVLFDPPPPAIERPLPKGLRYRPPPPMRTWRVVPPPQRAATPEQAAAHYGLRVETVERYDRRAREVLNRIRAAAGLIGDDVRVPVWPAVQSDENLLAYLFDGRW